MLFSLQSAVPLCASAAVCAGEPNGDCLFEEPGSSNRLRCFLLNLSRSLARTVVALVRGSMVVNFGFTGLQPTRLLKSIFAAPSLDQNSLPFSTPERKKGVFTLEGASVSIGLAVTSIGGIRPDCVDAPKTKVRLLQFRGPKQSPFMCKGHSDITKAQSDHARNFGADYL
jgi:hypothetical protein